MLSRVQIRIIAVVVSTFLCFILGFFLIDYTANHSALKHLQIPIIFTFATIIAALLLYFLQRCIGHPLSILSQALEQEKPDWAEKIIKSNNDFSSIAKLALQSFRQKQKLIEEISDRKKTEEQLRQSEERYRTLVEISPDAIIMMDSQGRILLCNQHAVQLFGFSGDELILNRPVYELFIEDDRLRFENHISEVNKANHKAIEYTAKKNDSATFPAELNISVVHGQSGDVNAYIAVLRDITFRKQAEVENMRLQEQFRAVYKMEAIGQLAGGVAHDFNNILGAISGYADIIRQRYSSDEKLEKYATMILSAATRAADLTSKLLTFARKGKLQMVPFNVHHVLSDVAEILERTIEKNIRIIQVLEAKNPIITGDPGQVQSAVMNLALNARDAMPQGGELIFRTTDVTLDEQFVRSKAYVITPGQYVLISVTDSGSGMDKKVMAHLFEPFFTTKEIGKGTGLGLASVYGSVKSHNGYIDVVSDSGKGSIFSMYFPSVACTNLITNETSTALIRGRGNILVIDDESFLRDALREMLTWLGYSVKTTADASEGIAYFKLNHTSIDLVILDMIMPGMNGRECFHNLCLIKPDVKVLLSTGYSLDEERLQILQEGIAGIIQKPFVSAQLAKAVHDAFNFK